MISLRSAVVVGMLVAVALSRPAAGGVDGLQRVASGLSSPMFVTHAPGDTDRIFIGLRGSPATNTNATAQIRILDLNTGVLNPTPFLSIPGLSTEGEGGLLGMAFHPDYYTVGKTGYGKFYVYVTVEGEDDFPMQSRIREYSVSASPNVASASSLKEVLRWDKPAENHNGGWIGFNPKEPEAWDEDLEEGSYLYIMSGDGGEDYQDGDPANNAQSITSNKLGKALRIDVDGDDFPGTTGENATKNYSIPTTNPFVGVTGDDEIWSYGLRNPFRASFDRQTGDLWIADVGLTDKEEINMEANGGPGGANYGWRIMEGTDHRLDEEPIPSDYVGPVYDYDNTSTPYGPFEGGAVIGGYVYRGLDVDLYGKYLFTDFLSRNYWTFDPDDPYGSVERINSLLTPDAGSLTNPMSMGEDAMGNLYIMDSNEVFRIVTDNNVLPGDYNDDGIVDHDDFEFWKTAYETSNLAADGNGDGRVGAADFTIWRDHLGGRDIMAGAGSGAIAAVPEPAAVILLGLLAAAFLTSRRAFLRN